MKGNQKFPKRERILRPGEFRELYREGRKYSVREFLLFVKAGDQGPTRCGFTVSKRMGSAVTRNRIKRYLKEVFRTQKGELKPDLKMAIVARPGSEQLNFTQCREKVVKLFQKGHVTGG